MNKCKWFVSYAEDYFDDMESNEFGFCTNEKNKNRHDFMATIGKCCNLYEDINENKDN